MKKIEAIVRRTKFKEVKNELKNAGFDFFSYWLVRDMSVENETSNNDEDESEASASERILLTFVVEDKDFYKATQIIVNSGTTREAGDGRILVTDLKLAMRIHTDEGKDKTTFY